MAFFSNWAFWLLVVLVGLMVMAGTPVEGQPLVTGAATLLTFPLSVVNALAATPFGTILLPFIFIGLVYYLKTLHERLGTDVTYFVILAALILAFTAVSK